MCLFSVVQLVFEGSMKTHENVGLRLVISMPGCDAVLLCGQVFALFVQELCTLKKKCDYGLLG